MLIQNMTLENVEQVATIFEETMRDSWKRHEMDYYPREARAYMHS